MGSTRLAISFYALAQCATLCSALRGRVNKNMECGVYDVHSGKLFWKASCRKRSMGPKGPKSIELIANTWYTIHETQKAFSFAFGRSGGRQNYVRIEVPCPTCSGMGSDAYGTCDTCDGEAYSVWIKESKFTDPKKGVTLLEPESGDPPAESSSSELDEAELARWRKSMADAQIRRRLPELKESTRS